MIPTEDYDIKLADMSQVSVFEAALKNPLSTINAEQLLAELNKRSDTPIQSVDFEWVDMKNVPGGRRLLAKLRVPAHTAQTGREFFSYPIVEFSPSPGVKADSIDDYRYRTANGVYVASPEYIKEDMCKVWPTSGKSKAPRREAKYKYWNLVFPAGHRLHQPKAFQCDKYK